MIAIDTNVRVSADREDAPLVAVCLEHGARTLLTEDRDFARFRGVETRSLREVDPIFQTNLGSR